MITNSEVTNNGQEGAMQNSEATTLQDLQVIGAVVVLLEMPDIERIFNISEQEFSDGLNQVFKKYRVHNRSEYTVKHHLTHIFDKLGVGNRTELAMFAVGHNFLKPLESTSGATPQPIRETSSPAS